MSAKRKPEPASSPLDGIVAAAREGNGLTIRALAALILIRETPGRSTGELAKSLNCPKASATRNTTRLLDEKLVTSSIDPKDRRLVRLHPTPKGEALLARVENCA